MPSFASRLRKAIANQSSVWGTVSGAKIAREFARDYLRYLRLATPTAPHGQERLTGMHLECLVTKEYHRIEKGLAFGAPRRPFGAGPAETISTVLARPLDEADTAAPYLAHAEDALHALYDWNDKGLVADEVAPLGLDLKWEDMVGRRPESFFRSRRSVRDFDQNRSVDHDTIIRAVELAQTAPSVCNRQAGRAHYYDEPEMMAKILARQSGNRGFGHLARGLFIVTADARLFSGSGERNQRWIDGGLFAMTLVLALHALGVASCMLGWSKGNADSAALREIACIPDEEDVIVVIAVGYASEGHRVARSERRPLSQVLTLNQKKP